MSNVGAQKYSFGIPAAEMEASCRLPVLMLFLSGAVWLVIASILGFIASVKFHQPSFLADYGWLTYGRVHPAQLNSLLYGSGLPSGFAVALWLLARLGQTRLAQPWLIVAGAKIWNLGVLVGVLGILAGDGTGYESLGFPRYAAPILFLGYTIMGVWALVTFHRRSRPVLFPSQWFLVAALLWFPWIYSTANLLLLVFPVRGVMQSVVAWWYAANLQTVWFGLVGLAAVFYFIPRLTRRELGSRDLALVTFWALILVGGWTGVPNSAPLPAWMPALSSAASFLSITVLVAVALTLHRTLGGSYSMLSSSPSLQFIGFGAGAFLVAGGLNVLSAIPAVSRITDFTWFTLGKSFLGVYGFFAMVMFGAAYHIVPQLLGAETARPNLGRANFWVAAGGVVFLVAPLALGGIVQGMKLNEPTVAFMDVAQATRPFLHASTLGELLLGIGHVIFLANLSGLTIGFYRTRALAAYAAVTSELKTARANA